MPSGKIILTDWPKTKCINANMRGVETETLQKINIEMFHFMMCSHDEEAGGYIIRYDHRAVEEELKFRKVALHPAHGSCHGIK